MPLKNAILIVEFAKMKKEEGMEVAAAALDAAKLRLRPILMTSFAFILGVLPLVRAAGAGAEVQKGYGTRSIFWTYSLQLFLQFSLSHLFL
ncbi:MAG: efflux RND transporter permease subunit [Ignavibacteriales bacterium]|nr:efflux RND transporter permease subunit [Ignavibacteriales bacterium]